MVKIGILVSIFFCFSSYLAVADDVAVPAVIVYPHQLAQDLKKEMVKQQVTKADNLLQELDHINAMMAQKNGKIIELANSLKQNQDLLDKTKNEVSTSSDQLAEKQQQVNLLKQELENRITQTHTPASDNQMNNTTQEANLKNQVVVLKEQLRLALAKTKDLQKQLQELSKSFDKDIARAKLKQALDKIQEQGQKIDLLSQKLQDQELSFQAKNLTKSP